ncbi:hypothetical protein RA210_U290027 [Rubrivivax sp. A210]|nr:hypothetical protein RA210_U290027 [Rubrivivax sp. A210]
MPSENQQSVVASSSFPCVGLPPVLPNPSFNRTSYGRPPWPELRYAVHSLSSDQGGLPPLAG